MAIIDLQHIKKIYGKGDAAVTALSDINWQVEPGEFWSIVGPSGSGKSTLLNLIGCMDKPSDGQYLLKGEDVGEFSSKALSSARNSKVSFVFQQFALLNEYKVYDNIELPLLCKRMSMRARKELIHKYAKYLGIENLLKKKPTQISGGQQQRVAIARALVTESDIILADEPTGALDQKTGLEVIRLLRELNQSGKTIILVTHNQEVARMSDHILEIRDGEITNLA